MREIKKKLEELKIMQEKNPRFMFAVIWQDKTGQTIHLFKRKEMAEEFYKVITN